MVSVEGEECGELHPAIAEFFVCVAVEATGVDAEHGDSEEGEGEGLWDGEEHVGPKRGVVSTPVASPFSRSGKGGAADDEGTFGWEDVQEGMIGCVENLVTEEVVVVVFESSAVVGGVGTYGMYIKSSLHIIDYVWWVFDRSDTWCGCGADVSCRGRRCWDSGS